MASIFHWRHLAQHRLGWVCAGAAVLGVGFGTVLSLEIMERAGADGLTQVQRLPLDGNRAPGRATANAKDQLKGPAEAELAEGAISLAETGQDAQLAPKMNEDRRGTEKASGSIAASSHEAGLIRSNFDLGDAQRTDEPIEISKAIILNGRELGIATVSIDQRSRLRVSAKDLSRLLPSELHDRIATGESHIAFDELRDAGLDISYDPLGDVIRIKS